MKRRLLFFFILFGSFAFAQNNIYRSGGITQTVGAPTFTPGASGNIVAIDTVTGEWYVNPNRLSGASWISAGYRLTNISGSVPPAYTPTAHQSHFVVNAANQLYYWNGSSWQSVGGGGGGGSTDALRLKFIVVNKSGGTLNKGEVVYVSGAQGNRVAVKKALASVDSLSANTLGVMDETVANNGEGYCIAEGLVSGINTSAFTEGAALYLSPTTAGAITQTKTTAPDHLVLIGYCVKSNAGSGEISVHIQNGYELGELHDVYVPAPSNGQVLTYNTTNTRWEAATVADQSTTNEGIIGVSAGSATTSVITSNTSTANGVTVSAGTGISLSETTSTNGGTITVTNSAPDQTVSIANGGGITPSGTYPNFTLTAADQSATNELQTIDTFSLSGQTLSASLSLDAQPAKTVTLPVVNVTAGTGISVSSATGNYTVTNSAPDQTVSITNGGGVGVTGSYPSFTLTATDQSVTNEIQRLDTFSLSGQTLRASLLNDGVATSSVTLPIIDVVAGTNVTVTKSNGVATVSATGGGGGGGTVTGTGVAGRAAFWRSTSAISSDANFAWDSTNVRLNIGAPSAPTARLNVRGGGTTSATVNLRLTDSGNTELLKVLDNGSTNIGTGFNWNNTNSRLGIGTSSPSSPLTVIGNGDVLRVDGSAVSSRVTLVLAAHPASYSQIIASSGTAFYLSGGSSTDIGISPGLIDYHMFNKLGNVGIGTLSPSGRMNIRGSNTSSGTNALLVQNSTPSDLYKIENNGKISYWATNTAAGTTGPQTIDRPSGTVNFGIGAGSLVVTNSLCTTNSIVFATVRTNDSTAYIKNVVPAAGSFTINLGANATAETSVGFFIIN